eukprot:CAMPEP_0172471558 /NCGR_PEP_ID=MMETSP1065-20121228/67873_1 /TAXON_ID=265537 /ORGANISM="Amphiprora paludosa, Strain CCMP125" /LENGTH=267 /DNA_ID=CAMNT_0013229661 /DNA_START=572 /DNA_END=1375 /DNA_ORIENTATION=+
MRNQRNYSTTSTNPQHSILWLLFLGLASVWTPVDASFLVNPEDSSLLVEDDRSTSNNQRPSFSLRGGGAIRSANHKPRRLLVIWTQQSECRNAYGVNSPWNCQVNSATFDRMRETVERAVARNSELELVHGVREPTYIELTWWDAWRDLIKAATGTLPPNVADRTSPEIAAFRHKVQHYEGPWSLNVHQLQTQYQVDAVTLIMDVASHWHACGNDSLAQQQQTRDGIFYSALKWTCVQEKENIVMTPHQQEVAKNEEEEEYKAVALE